MKTIYGTIIAVKLGNRLLLLKRREGVWEFPKGKFERYNHTIRTTAERELREETGLKINEMKYIGSIKRVDGEKVYIGQAYIAYSLSDRVKVSEEHKEYRWVKIDELESYKLEKNTLIFLEVFKDLLNKK